MASPAANAENSETASSFVNAESSMFQTSVAGLLFLRGLNSDLDFRLAAHVDETGALGDVIVFKIRGDNDKWASYFIQLKQKEKSPIEHKMRTNSNLCELRKYIDFYEIIKEATWKKQGLFDVDIEGSIFVIFTNAKPSSNLWEERQGSEQIDAFLGSSSEKIFRFHPDSDAEAEEAIETLLTEHSLKKQTVSLKKESVENEKPASDARKNVLDDWKDFLTRHRIFGAQPSECEFEVFIKAELQKAVGAGNDNIDVDRLCACFLENLTAWSENRNVLHRGSDLFASARDRVLAETVSLDEVNVNKLDLVFEDAALLSLREVLGSASPVVLVRSSEQSSRLTCTKLLQTFDSSTFLFFGSERFLSNQEAVISEWGRGQRNSLIVSLNNRDSTIDESHFKEIVKIAKTFVHPKKQLVILTNVKVEMENGWQYLEDTFKFSSILSTSRNNFLNSKFTLQSRSIRFKPFLDKRCNNDINVLSASSVVEIIEAWPKLADISDEKYSDNLEGDVSFAILLCNLALATNCPLHTAVLIGDVAGVDSLLKEGADVNARDRAGRTPLHLIANLGHDLATDPVKHDKIRDLLIKSPGVDVNIKDTDLVNGTPLWYAQINKDWPMMDKLLALGAVTDCLTVTSNCLGDVTFWRSIVSNDLDRLLAFCFERCTALFEPQRSLSPGAVSGTQLLGDACFHGSQRVAKLLVDRGADINGPLPSAEAKSYPPLHSAAKIGNLEIVKLLVEKASVLFPSRHGTRYCFTYMNFFVNRRASEGQTALHLALKFGHLDVAIFLIDNGADFTIRDDAEFTCLHFAAAYKLTDAMSKMLGRLGKVQGSTLVNQGSKKKFTSVHFAARSGSLEAVTILVNAGGKMSANTNGVTPLMLAAKAGHLDVVQYLVETFEGERDRRTGVKWIDARDVEGWTALLIGGEYKREDVVAYLTERGADPRWPVKEEDEEEVELPERVDLPGRVDLTKGVDFTKRYNLGEGLEPINFEGIELIKGVDLPDRLDLLEGVELPERVDLTKGVDLPEWEELPERLIYRRGWIYLSEKIYHKG